MKKDRCYIIENNGSQNVSIAAAVVERLIGLNQPGRRENTTKDKTFVKALLIAVCSLQFIRNLSPNQKPPKPSLNFIKGTEYFAKILLLRHF